MRSVVSRLLVLLFAALAGFLALHPPVAQAIPVTPEAKIQLDSILRQPEYQPRSRTTWSESIGRITQAGLRVLKNWITEFFDGLFGGARGLGLFSLPDWLASLFYNLGIAINIIILAGIAYLLYRIIRPLLPERSEPDGLAEIAAIKLIDPSDLFEKQSWAELLGAIRLGLRRALTDKLGFPDSATDREVIGIAATADSGGALTALFRRVASAFEAAAFAGLPLDGPSVAGFYRDYRRLSPMETADQSDSSDESGAE